MPSAASSAKASLSSSTLTETKATPCLVRNSFILRQLVQPGCQYALITGGSCGMACSINAHDTASTRGSKGTRVKRHAHVNCLLKTQTRMQPLAERLAGRRGIDVIAPTSFRPQAGGAGYPLVSA